ncbi:hypothetical protein PM082_016794 [Marasmius tenuissimus]|nr:hypothetical protein PM082_016794 [Marasmius tenuissimus]
MAARTTYVLYKPEVLQIIAYPFFLPSPHHCPRFVPSVPVLSSRRCLFLSIILHPLNLSSSLKSLVNSSILEPGHSIIGNKCLKGRNRMGRNRWLFLLFACKSNAVTEHQGAYMR